MWIILHGEKRGIPAVDSSCISTRQAWRFGRPAIPPEGYPTRTPSSHPGGIRSPWPGYASAKVISPLAAPRATDGLPERAQVSVERECRDIGGGACDLSFRSRQQCGSAGQQGPRTLRTLLNCLCPLGSQMVRAVPRTRAGPGRRRHSQVTNDLTHRYLPFFAPSHQIRCETCRVAPYGSRHALS